MEIKPAPAIPEEVEQRMARGMAAIKAVKKPVGCRKVFLARENVDGLHVWHSRGIFPPTAQKGRPARPQRATKDVSSGGIHIRFSRMARMSLPLRASNEGLRDRALREHRGLTGLSLPAGGLFQQPAVRLARRP